MNYIDPIAAWLGPWAVRLSVGAIFLRLSLSLVLSAFIGWERTSKRHSAGMRSFMLVGVAATGVMILDNALREPGGSYPYFISAAVLIALAVLSTQSIGFSSRNRLKGLTTTFGLLAWAVVSLAIGAGLYTAALLAFVFLLCELWLFPAIERPLKRRSAHFLIHLELKSSEYLENFVTTIRRLGLTIEDIERNPAYDGSGLSVYTIMIDNHSPELKKFKTHEQIIEALSTLDYISHIEELAQ